MAVPKAGSVVKTAIGDMRVIDDPEGGVLEYCIEQKVIAKEKILSLGFGKITLRKYKHETVAVKGLVPV